MADYPVHYFLTAEGYFKKVTPQSLRMSGEHKLKEGDRISQALEGNNTDELLFITDRQQVYKVRSADLEETRISVLGSYLPQLLEMDEGESVLFMAVAKGGEFDGTLLFVFENGKIARIQFDQYATKTNRRRLVNAYSDRSPLTAVVQLSGEEEIYLETAAGRALIFNSSAITPKTSNSIGVSDFPSKQRQGGFAGLESKVVNVPLPCQEDSAAAHCLSRRTEAKPRPLLSKTLPPFGYRNIQRAVFAFGRKFRVCVLY